MLNGYYKLYDDCVAFLNEFAPARKGIDNFIAGGAAPSFQVTQQLRQSVLYLFPKYQKLRKQQRDLERVPMPNLANLNGKDNERERELVESIGRIKGAVDGKMYYQQTGGAAAPVEQTIDAYIKYCVHTAPSLPDGNYGAALRMVHAVS